MHIKIASIMLIASVLGLGALAPLTYTKTAVAQQEDLIQAIAGGFESISVVQDEAQIVITITKEGGEAPPPGDNETVPTDPIVIIPDPGGEGNGTVIVPEPGNGTIPSGGNVTEPGEPPVIVVDPGNNDTIVVEPPTNVTQIDNDTVIIAPPDQNVTETPGNVTVVDPPAANVTEPGVPSEPCACPPVTDGGPTLPINETGSQPVQPPAAADNTTVIVEQPEPVPAPPEEGAGEDADEPGDNDGGGDGEEGGG